MNMRLHSILVVLLLGQIFDLGCSEDVIYSPDGLPGTQTNSKIDVNVEGRDQQDTSTQSLAGSSIQPSMGISSLEKLLSQRRERPLYPYECPLETIPGKSIGKVLLGMDLASVRDALNKEKVTVSGDSTNGKISETSIVPWPCMINGKIEECSGKVFHYLVDDFYHIYLNKFDRITKIAIALEDDVQKCLQVKGTSVRSIPQIVKAVPNCGELENKHGGTEISCEKGSLIVTWPSAGEGATLSVDEKSEE